MDATFNISRYTSYVNVYVKDKLAYKLDLIASTLFTSAWPIMMVFVWAAVYYASGASTISGFSVNQIYVYFFAVAIADGFTMMNMLWDVENDVQNGLISGYLARPISYVTATFMKQVANFLFFMVTIGIPLFLIAYFLFGLYISPTTMALFAVSALFGFALSFLLFFTVSCLSFYMVNADGVFSVSTTVSSMLAGAFFPLTMLPQSIQNITSLLPFQFFYWVPAGILVGSISTSAAIGDFAIGLVWIAVFILVMRFAWGRTKNKINAVGV